MPDSARPPLAIVCFDRPDYTRQCVTALAGADGITERDVAVFIDGPPPEHWRDNAAPYQRGDHRDYRDRIEEVAGIVSEHLPNARQFRSEKNLGIALNVRRALQWSFHDRSTRFAYMIEDDVVVSPSWLRIMDMLSDFAGDRDRVGFFGASGVKAPRGPGASPALGQLAFNGPHLRASGQGREHFLRVDAILTPFYARMNGIDYRGDSRPRAIMSMKPVFEALGGRPGALGQDGLRVWASFNLGYIGVNTCEAWTRYIGADGIHSTPAHFARLRASRRSLQLGIPTELLAPDADTLESSQARLRELFAAALAEKEPIRRRLGRLVPGLRRAGRYVTAHIPSPLLRASTRIPRP